MPPTAIHTHTYTLFVMLSAKNTHTLQCCHLTIFLLDSMRQKLYESAGIILNVDVGMIHGKFVILVRDVSIYQTSIRLFGHKTVIRPSSLRRNRNYVLFYQTWIWGALTCKNIVIFSKFWLLFPRFPTYNFPNSSQLLCPYLIETVTREDCPQK